MKLFQTRSPASCPENLYRTYFMIDTIDMQALGEKIERHSDFIEDIYTELDKVIIGQRYIIDSLLIGHLSVGYFLLFVVLGLAYKLCELFSNSVCISGIIS